MTNHRNTRTATLLVVATGALWGVYWFPVRRLTELALAGAWGTFTILAAAAILLAPVAIRRRRRLAAAGPFSIATIALGGVAFTLYSVGFAYGRVAIVILLFYLTPVWSTLLARFLMKERTPRLRVASIGVGIAGLLIMLSTDGSAPLPRGAGEWLALMSGILWSLSTTGMRSRPGLSPGEAAFAFVLGGLAAAAVLAPLLAPLPANLSVEDAGPILGWAMLGGGLWWVLSMVGLMWATPRLEPARVGILLMAEVVVGTLSAFTLANEQIARIEIVGGGLVVLAGILEVWPVRRSTSAV
jgi:drug/metabolite transporter (DMT)-like permease